MSQTLKPNISVGPEWERIFAARSQHVVESLKPDELEALIATSVPTIFGMTSSIITCGCNVRCLHTFNNVMYLEPFCLWGLRDSEQLKASLQVASDESYVVKSLSIRIYGSYSALWRINLYDLI